MNGRQLKDFLRQHQLWLNSAGRLGRRVDWREANLAGVHLPEANLNGALLGAADLRGANLKLASLIQADMTGADLRGANLWWADLRAADLGRADLRWADLQQARLSQANLVGAKLDFSSWPLAQARGIKADDRVVAQLAGQLLALDAEACSMEVKSILIKVRATGLERLAEGYRPSEDR